MDFVVERAAVGGDAVLGQVADGDVVGSIDAAGVVLFLVGYELEQSGFACSVGADEADAVFGSDGGSGVAEEVAFAVLERYVSKCENGGEEWRAFDSEKFKGGRLLFSKKESNDSFRSCSQMRFGCSFFGTTRLRYGFLLRLCYGGQVGLAGG